MKFPAHEAAMYLTHNEYKTSYETIEDFISDNTYTFKDADAKQRCIATKEIWTLQWYPDVPIGFYAVAAPTFDELMEFANA